jgi:hypothetical protein
VHRDAAFVDDLANRRFGGEIEHGHASAAPSEEECDCLADS